MPELSNFKNPVACPEYETSLIPATANLGPTSTSEIPDNRITGSAPLSHLRIQGGVNGMDQARVEQILLSTAERFTMVETSVTSGVRGTLCSYSESPQGGFAAGARILAGDMVVDFCAGNEPSPRFQALVEHICAELRRAFVERIVVVKI